MNLFIFDTSPVLAARMNCDRHVLKICIEASQLLCSAFWCQNIPAPFKISHKNHPVSIWVRQSRENFDWAARHGLELCAEYTARYGKTHKCESIIEWCIKNSDQLKFPEEKQTPFALAMPDKYKTTCAVESYRSYFKTEKQHLFSWKKNKPNWL
jgi:hypothetical protein